MNKSREWIEAAAEIVGSVNAQIAEIDERLAMLKGVIFECNSVVRVFPGLYLVPKGAGYGVGAITAGVVSWSPSNAAKMAEEAQKQSPEAKAVYLVDALNEERAVLVALANSVSAKMDPAAA